MGKINNLFYYRVFLWHNYSLLVLLAFIGFLSLILQKKRAWQILVLFLMTQTIVVSFILRQPFVRFFYIVFPFLVLLSAVGLVEICQLFSRAIRLRTSLSKALLLIFSVLLVMIVMGDKFSFFPQRVYSLNEDMLEIPEVDWKRVYRLVGQKLDQNQNSVLVTNWTDLPVWFLGEGKLDYLLRKDSLAESDPFTNAEFISNLAGFKNLLQEKEKGLIVIDSWDDYVPEGVREYCREFLKKELEIDRLYPVQPRYWPVEVYSWGM